MISCGVSKGFTAFHTSSVVLHHSQNRTDGISAPCAKQKRQCIFHRLSSLNHPALGFAPALYTIAKRRHGIILEGDRFIQVYARPVILLPFPLL